MGSIKPSPCCKAPLDWYFGNCMFTCTKCGKDWRMSELIKLKIIEETDQACAVDYIEQQKEIDELFGSAKND